MTDADRRAFDDANRHRVPGSQQPQPHFTLTVQNDLDSRGYNSLTVQADGTSNVDDVARRIRTLGVGAATARSFVDQQLRVFQIVGYVLGGIGGIALAVAAIGVVNTMVMAILERTREIGVLRACGATRATVRRLFTIEAGLLGFLGGVLGVGGGFGLTRVANVVINRQLTAGSVQARDIIGLPLWLIGAVVGATTLIGILAGLYPAVRASRLNPVEALRYE
jgi:ABC-type antimicrobial peptide transport system permease subunit